MTGVLCTVYGAQVYLSVWNGALQTFSIGHVILEQNILQIHYFRKTNVQKMKTTKLTK